jgi:hypothetical protein
MVKRGSVEDFGTHRGQILTEVEHLILSGDPPRVSYKEDHIQFYKMTSAALYEDTGNIPLMLPSMMPSRYDTPSVNALMYVGTPVYKNVGSVNHVITHASGMSFIVIGLWPANRVYTAIKC